MPTSPRYWNLQSDFGAVGDGVTDDTVHVQQALDTIDAADGGDLNCEDGIYQLASAPTFRNGTMAQIHLPSRALGVDPGIGLTIRGRYPVPSIGAAFGGGGSVVAPVKGVVFRSTANVSGASVLGVHAPVGAAYPFSILHLVLENLTIRTQDNPLISGLDLGDGGPCELRNVTVDTGVYDFNAVTQPSRPESFGVRLPRINNSGAGIHGTLKISGYYTGLVAGEHMVVGDLQTTACLYALEVGNQFHPMLITRWGLYHCPYGLRCVATTDPTQLPQLDILQWAHERLGPTDLPAWQRLTTALIDPLNVLRGSARYSLVQQVAGQVAGPLPVSGATEFVCTNLVEGPVVPMPPVTFPVMEHWDGVTPPAMPSGWTSVGAWDTRAASSPSAPNVLSCSTVGSVALTTFNTRPPSADTTISASIAAAAIHAQVNQEILLVSRWTTQAWAGNPSGYYASLFVGTAEDGGVHLGKMVAGVATQLGSVVPTAGNAFVANTFYRLVFSLIVTQLSLTVQRLTDGQYLTPAGAWQSASVAALTLTDTTISARGYAGLAQFISGLTRWSLDDVGII